MLRLPQVTLDCLMKVVDIMGESLSKKFSVSNNFYAGRDCRGVSSMIRL